MGLVLSDRPGLWRARVVDSHGLHALHPEWYSGVTYRAFHDTEPRMLAGSREEVIEIDLRKRRWRRHALECPVHGVSYFGAGVAVVAGQELLLAPGLHAASSARLRVTPRNAEVVSFRHHRVLMVPTGEDRNVFLARRGRELVIVGLLEARARGSVVSPEGDFVRLESGCLRLIGLEEAIDDAPVLEHESLDECGGPSIPILQPAGLELRGGGRDA